MPASRGPDDDLASHAKYLLVGSWCGLVGLEEIGTWADARFHERASPPAGLMDLAFALKGDWRGVAVELDSIARSGRENKIRAADARDLLDRLASAIDADRFGPCQMVHALDWLTGNMPYKDDLRREIRGEASRFRLRWRRDGRLKHARSELRRWLERARRDPSTAA
jgi:hypothetical protein